MKRVNPVSVCCFIDFSVSMFLAQLSSIIVMEWTGTPSISKCGEVSSIHLDGISKFAGPAKRINCTLGNPRRLKRRYSVITARWNVYTTLSQRL
jgi:hypothetical protein